MSRLSCAPNSREPAPAISRGGRLWGAGGLNFVIDRINRMRLWRRCVAVNGCRLRASSLDRLIYLWWHRFRGSGAEFNFLRSALRPGMHVVDAGANVGLYTCLFAHAVGPRGRVDAFEPEPGLYAALKENARANGLSQVHPACVALGAATGGASLCRSPFNSGDNRLDHAVTCGRSDQSPVPVVALDTYLEDRPVHFVKVDVQGWELQVLEGMSGCLAANPGIQLYVEVWPFGLVRQGIEPSDLFRFLAERDFRWTFPFGPHEGDVDFREFASREDWYCDLYARRQV